MQSHSNISCKFILKYWSELWERVHNFRLWHKLLFLNFHHYFLILLSWLLYHVQIKQQKNKVGFRWFVARWGGWGFPLVQVVLGGFQVVLKHFCWLRMISDGFWWFAALVITPILQHTEELTLYYTHGRTGFTKKDYCFLVA